MLSKLFRGLAGAAVASAVVLTGAHAAGATTSAYRCCVTTSPQPFVFASTRTGHTQIWSQYADGSGLRQLTTNNSNNAQPSINGSRSQVAYASTASLFGPSSIFVMNADGNNQHAVTATGTRGLGDRMPSFNAAGTKIAFTSDRTGSDQLYEMNADGTGLVQLTQAYDGGHGNPAWSPDGNHIAYLRNYNGVSDVWMMNPDGTGAQRETFDGHATWAGRPAWSPDGQKIAYGDDIAGHSEVFYSWAFSVQSPIHVTNRGGAEGPTWSPDGTSILYGASAGSSGAGQLFSTNLSNGAATMIVNSAGTNFQANWGYPSPPPPPRSICC